MSFFSRMMIILAVFLVEYQVFNTYLQIKDLKKQLVTITEQVERVVKIHDDLSFNCERDDDFYNDDEQEAEDY